jgi:hypothetical protein
MVYKYYVVGHYPSPCLYLKIPSCLFLKTQRFGDWICLRLQVKPTQLGLIDRASPYRDSPKRCVLKNKQDGVFR